MAGEPGATGVHAVCRVGLVLASEVGNATIQPRVLAANSVRDFLWETSHAMKDPALVGIELALRYLLEQFKTCRTTANEQTSNPLATAKTVKNWKKKRYAFSKFDHVEDLLLNLLAALLNANKKHLVNIKNNYVIVTLTSDKQPQTNVFHPDHKKSYTAILLAKKRETGYETRHNNTLNIIRAFLTSLDRLLASFQKLTGRS